MANEPKPVNRLPRHAFMVLAITGAGLTLASEWLVPPAAIFLKGAFAGWMVAILGLRFCGTSANALERRAALPVLVLMLIAWAAAMLAGAHSPVASAASIGLGAVGGIIAAGWVAAKLS